MLHQCGGSELKERLFENAPLLCHLSTWRVISLCTFAYSDASFLHNLFISFFSASWDKLKISENPSHCGQIHNSWNIIKESWFLTAATGTQEVTFCLFEPSSVNKSQSGVSRSRRRLPFLPRCICYRLQSFLTQYQFLFAQGHMLVPGFLPLYVQKCHESCRGSMYWQLAGNEVHKLLFFFSFFCPNWVKQINKVGPWFSFTLSSLLPCRWPFCSHAPPLCYRHRKQFIKWNAKPDICRFLVAFLVGYPPISRTCYLLFMLPLGPLPVFAPLSIPCPSINLFGYFFDSITVLARGFDI